MKEIAVGIALMYLVSIVFKKPISVKGLPSILFMLVINYGLGLLAFKWLDLAKAVLARV